MTKTEQRILDKIKRIEEILSRVLICGNFDIIYSEAVNLVEHTEIFLKEVKPEYIGKLHVEKKP